MIYYNIDNIIDGVLCFAKNLSNKYSQKLLDSATKTTKDALKVASKRAIQKTAEATSDLIGNKIANKITKASQKMLIMKYQKKDIRRKTTNYW